MISFPHTRFIDFTFDIKERLIIGIVENENMINPDNQDFLNMTIDKYEFHIIKVHNEMVWKRVQSFDYIKNITFFSYNYILNIGVVVEYYNSS